MSSMHDRDADGRYLRLGKGFHLKLLEEPCVYDAGRDELYELSPEAFELLARCDGSRTAAELQPEADFLDYCLEEGIIEALDRPRRRPVRVGHNERPSLRYLMVEVTDRCNLRCRHCYLGDAGSTDLDWDTARKLLDDFDDIGGLRLMITGGEPVLYPHFHLLNRELKGRSYRSVLISNGTLLEESEIRGLNFQEIQLSVDGLEQGHDFLRGKGSFRKVMAALSRALAAGRDVSVATVIHSRNLEELERLGETLQEMGVSAWTLEYPVAWGRMQGNLELMPEPSSAAPFFEMEWGWGAHEGAEGFACGAHLAAVEPGGQLVKCGYYREWSGGHVGSEGGLRGAWLALPKMRLEGACLRCDLLPQCGGGCRFRAQLMAGEGGPDPLMCARMGRAMQ